MRHNFLLELGTEELPARYLRSLGRELGRRVEEELDRVGVGCEDLDWFATPRRLAVVASLLDRQRGDLGSREGPPVGGRPVEVGTAADVVAEDGTPPARSSSAADRLAILRGVAERAVDRLALPQRMRWSGRGIQFVRPVRTVAVLLRRDVVPGNVLGIEIGRTLRGSRFGRSGIDLERADRYAAVLLSHRVLASYEQRREKIRAGVTALAESGGRLVELDEDLLEELTGLVEWPVILDAEFEPRFLSLPAEMIGHILLRRQKCFPLRLPGGRLSTRFIFVTDVEPDPSRRVALARARAVNLQLEDIESLFESDRGERLAGRYPLLAGVTFHHRLGNLQERSERIRLLSRSIAGKIGADVELTSRAGLLSKCDLVTGTVSEHPEMQGVLGMYLARADGEEESVALAQREQYRPGHVGDRLPVGRLSSALAVADRLDLLVGLLGLGQLPSGERDPFKLKRAAGGLIRIVVEKNLPLDLRALVEENVRHYGGRLSSRTVVDDTCDFLLRRLISLYRRRGYPENVIRAVLGPLGTDLVDFDGKVRLLSHLLAGGFLAPLVTASKRIFNLLRRAEIGGSLLPALLREPLELSIGRQLRLLRAETTSDYRRRLVRLLELGATTNSLFRKVKILEVDPALRSNRLLLLSEVQKAFLEVVFVAPLYAPTPRGEQPEQDRHRSADVELPDQPGEV